MSLRSVLGRRMGGYMPNGYPPETFMCEIQVDVDAAAGDVQTVEFPFDVDILGFFVRVDDEAIGAVTTGGTLFAVTLDYTESGEARALKATITPADVDTTYALGEIMEPTSDLTAFTVSRGESIHFEHSVQAVLAGGGSSAGTVKMGVFFIPKYHVA